jgi:hypothetical protein
MPHFCRTCDHECGCGGPDEARCRGCSAECSDPDEPGDPDGEAFMGNEAREYEREQQADIQRNLK